MSIQNLASRPDFWKILLGGFILVLGLSLYLTGVSIGKSQAGVEFNRRQNDLLLKSQVAMAEADRYKKEADSAVTYANQLKIVAQMSSEKAQKDEIRISKVYEEESKELKQNYEADKLFIHSDLNQCDRCRDLCIRSNALTAYGPEFSGAACNPDSHCTEFCSP